MKIKVIKLFAALVSLVVGYAIVHSLTPKQVVVEPELHTLDFNNDLEVALDCVYGNTPYAVHFSAYQRPKIKVPGVNYQRPFCDKLPSLGATLITLDFMNNGLRDRSVALKFRYHDQPEVSAEALAIAPIFEESFHYGIPRGFIQSRLEFLKAGFYTLVIEFGEGVISDDEIVRIPFEVGSGL